MARVPLCACVIAILLLASLTASAQSWESVRALKSGDHVIVLESNGQEHAGALRSVNAETISVFAGKAEAVIDRTKIRTVKVRATAHRVRNVLIGAGIGLALALVVDHSLGTYFRNESGESDGARALTYIAPIGALAGIGAVLPGYRTVYRVK